MAAPRPKSAVERSAGVIAYRWSGHGQDRRREYLLLDYGRYWDFPKGHVEPREDDLAAAIRELAEETGIPPNRARTIDGFAKEITYFFRARGKLVRKQVAYFIAETDVADGQITISHEHVGFAFLAYDQAMARLKYPTAKQVLAAAGAFLGELGVASE